MKQKEYQMSESKPAEIGGAKVTLNPSEEVIKVANAETTCTDARGRLITIAEPNFLAQFRLTEAVGASSSNEAYMNMVRPLLYVKSIDGERVSPMSSKREVEALIQKLGADGYSALAESLVNQFASNDAEASQDEQLKK
jgi:hypothetical protein